MSSLANHGKLIPKKIRDIASKVIRNKPSRNTKSFGQFSLASIRFHRAQILHDVARVTVSRKNDRVHDVLHRRRDHWCNRDHHRPSEKVPGDTSDDQTACTDEILMLVLLDMLLEFSRAEEARPCARAAYGSSNSGKKKKA